MMQHKCYFKIFIVILLMIISQSLFATNHSQLNRLNQKIAGIKAFLSFEQTKRSRYQSELRRTEIASGNVLLKLKKTHKSLEKQQAFLKRLSQKATVYQSKLVNQRARLMQQIRATYVLGRQSYLKLILNQSNAEQINQILMYYRYISRDQILAIHQLQMTLRQLQNNQQQIQAQAQVLKQLESKQRKEHYKLKHVQRNRKILIRRINNQIHTKNQRLVPVAR